MRGVEAPRNSGADGGMMTTELWILLLMLAVLAVGFALMMRRLLRKSKEAERAIDRTKIRPWTDEE